MAKSPELRSMNGCVFTRGEVDSGNTWKTPATSGCSPRASTAVFDGDMSEIAHYDCAGERGTVRTGVDCPKTRRA
jgi:hypothetical protein